MPLVKLSFYDHFMVARGPSMLSTYRCAPRAAVVCAGPRGDSSRISFIMRGGRDIVTVFGNRPVPARSIKPRLFGREDVIGQGSMFHG